MDELFPYYSSVTLFRTYNKAAFWHTFDCKGFLLNFAEKQKTLSITWILLRNTRTWMSTWWSWASLKKGYYWRAFLLFLGFYHYGNICAHIRLEAPL